MNVIKFSSFDEFGSIRVWGGILWGIKKRPIFSTKCHFWPTMEDLLLSDPFTLLAAYFTIFNLDKFCYLHKSSLKFRDTKYTCIYFLSFPPMKISNGQILTQICFKFGSNFCGGGVFVEPVKVKVQLFQFKFSISATTREEACAN